VDITEAMETLRLFLDEWFERELAELEAEGAAADVLAQRRAELAAKRTELLAGVWENLERERMR
jgi:hypothetical protein